MQITSPSSICNVYIKSNDKKKIRLILPRILISLLEARNVKIISNSVSHFERVINTIVWWVTQYMIRVVSQNPQKMMSRMAIGFPIKSYRGTIKVTMGQQIMKFVFKCDVIIINDRLLPLRVPAHKTHLLPLSTEEEYQEQITQTLFFARTEKKNISCKTIKLV